MIKVFSFFEKDRWFVHGITINFCASAGTKDEAMLRFWSRLAVAMYGAHLEHGRIDSVVQPPDPKTLRELEKIAGMPLADDVPARPPRNTH